MKNSSRVVVQNDMVFVVTNDETLLSLPSKGYCYFIRDEIFEFVENFIQLAKPSLDPLMVSESLGTILYWEKDVHSILINKLHKMSGYPSGEISNSLSALGY